MYVRKKKYPSSNIGVIVVEKREGKMKEFAIIGIAHQDHEIYVLVAKANEWIDREKHRRPPRLDLFGEGQAQYETELLMAEQMLSCISNITIDRADMIINRFFDNGELNRIVDDIFRRLVKARLSYPASICLV